MLTCNSALLYVHIHNYDINYSIKSFRLLNTFRAMELKSESCLSVVTSYTLSKVAVVLLFP